MGGYQLLGLIARGGMGAVYEALEIALDRKVALKVIAPPNPDDHDSEELVQRFMQEARTLARVNHPSVITIYAIDTFEGVPFITMELVEGISFKELLAVSFLSADLAAPMFIQMLEGLQCLHSNRIVHRDLKPHNVMVRKDGQIKILDFGIAKPSDSGNFTHVGVVVGSLAYMAPEVKLGIAATERSDLWNLGAIFYECLTGRALPKVLAENDHPKEIPYAANSPIPLEIRAVIAKLCAQRPLDRYEGCEQAIEDIKAFQRKRIPITPDVMHAFGRKVEEILAKRRSDSRDMPASDVTPVQAAVLPMDAPATIAEYSERPYTPRERRTKRRYNPLHMGGAALGTFVLLGFLMKPKFDAQRAAVVAAAPEPVVQSQNPSPSDEPKPLQFKPPEPLALAIKLVSPKADEVLMVEPSVIPTLAWSRDLKNGEYGIQISTDRSFRKILFDESVSGTAFRPARVLAEGNYYWRLMPKAAAGEPVGPFKFTLVHPGPVALSEPGDNQSFEYAAKEKGADVHFSWECRPGAESYQFQIAKAPKFVSRERNLTGCEHSEEGLLTGSYRWRAREAGKIWSDSREFTVSKKAAAPVKVPVLVLGIPEVPGDLNMTLKFNGSPRDLASASKSIVEYPLLKWSPVRGARKYAVQIAADKGFDKLAVDEFSADTKFEWKSVKPGKYYWRVAAAAEKPGAFSVAGRLRVDLPAPELKSKYRFEAMLEGDKHVLNWEAIPFANKYIVQFGSKRDLASAEPQITTASEFTLPKKQGQYFVRVAAAGRSGEALSGYSEVAAVSIEPAASLDTPTLKFPKSGAATVSRSGRVSIAFEWSRVPRAERYVIELAHDQDFLQIAGKISSKENSHIMNKLDQIGRIYWRVRAESRDGVSSWSEPYHFEVRK